MNIVLLSELMYHVPINNIKAWLHKHFLELNIKNLNICFLVENSIKKYHRSYIILVV